MWLPTTFQAGTWRTKKVVGVVYLSIEDWTVATPGVSDVEKSGDTLGMSPPQASSRAIEMKFPNRLEAFHWQTRHETGSSEIRLAFCGLGWFGRSQVPVIREFIFNFLSSCVCARGRTSYFASTPIGHFLTPADEQRRTRRFLVQVNMIKLIKNREVSRCLSLHSTLFANR